MIFFSRKANCFSILLAAMILIFSCRLDHSGLDENGRKGKELAQKYCQSCHLLPDPSFADKKSWENGILPEMGPRFGIFHFNGRGYPSRRYDENVGRAFYPSKPIVTETEWAQIIAYYMQASPDSLPQQQKKYDIKPNTPVFKAIKPINHYHDPVTTYLGIDTTVTPRRILQAEGLLRDIYIYDDQLKLTDSIKIKGMLLDIISHKDSFVVCNVGVINPNDGRFGKIQKIKLNSLSSKSSDTGYRKADVLFDSLRRPVQLTEADLNGDNKKDFIVCEFGNMRGALSWLENKGDGTYNRHVLRAEPGAIRAIVQDYNHDGLPDIWVLFAQGDEGIFLFTNKGNGQFEQQSILRFPAIYGSSHFDLVDFNGDGYADILYTCGDNADYSTVLKPYHGVYIFMNDGHQHFEQRFFYPIHGCYKAIAKDFDGDGDLDIATISFFADYINDPAEGFVYFENKGNLDFQPYTVPEAAGGRWLTMDAGDVDGDGKPDILLGNFSVGPRPEGTRADWKNGPPILLLKNVK